MDFIVVYGILLLLFFITFFAKGWHKISSASLYSQKIFWVAIGVPLSAFFFFGYFAWSGHTPELSAEGFNRFVSISTLPLGLLSLSIPLVAIMTSVHRSIQTETQIEKANVQIELAKKKNTLDEFFLREKNFVDKCAFIEKQAGDLKIILKNGPINVSINIISPHKLYRNIYETSPVNDIVTYDFSSLFSQNLVCYIKAIEENIKYQCDSLFNEGKRVIDEEFARLVIITDSLCRTFDLLCVAVFPTPVFEVYFNDLKRSLCVSSEDELKYLLRKYIMLIDALVNAVGYNTIDYMSNEQTRMYANLKGYIFPIFNQGIIKMDFIGASWIDKTRVA